MHCQGNTRLNSNRFAKTPAVFSGTRANASNKFKAERKQMHEAKVDAIMCVLKVYMSG